MECCDSMSCDFFGQIFITFCYLHFSPPHDKPGDNLLSIKLRFLMFGIPKIDFLSWQLFAKHFAVTIIQLNKKFFGVIVSFLFLNVNHSQYSGQDLVHCLVLCAVVVCFPLSLSISPCAFIV